MAEPPRFLDQVRATMRARRYSLRTETAYVAWVRRFILFHGKRHPSTMGTPEVNEFLTHLAVERKVSAATQNQALSALLYLYDAVLNAPLSDLGGVIRATKPERLPVVLSRDEVTALLARLDGIAWIVGTMLYGSGMRLLECLRLRVKDVDFSRAIVTVREGKGDRDRRTMLPAVVSQPLRDHIEQVRAQHVADLAEGFGSVWLPHALSESIPVRRQSGRGNTSFRRQSAASIHEAERSAGITSTNK